jgi:hypothetical protein
MAQVTKRKARKETSESKALAFAKAVNAVARPITTK